jgi:hypothetical protein
MFTQNGPRRSRGILEVYGSTPSLISASDGVDGQHHVTPRPFYPEKETRHQMGLVVNTMPLPGRFSPEKETRYPLYRRLGGPQGRYGCRKFAPPPRNSIPGPCVRRESLYRLSYPGPACCFISFRIVTGSGLL